MISAICSATTRLTDALERARGLDAIAEPLATALSKVIGRGPVNDALSGTVTGHPLHPALVLAPAGSWLSAAVLDLASGPRSHAAATRLIGFGNLAALPAALAGASDWIDTAGAERRVGLVHALTNMSALSLCTASWLTRRRGNRDLGVALSMSGMALAAAAGWLGGHLAYAKGVGVDTTAFQHAISQWTTVGVADQLHEGEPILVRAHGIPVLLVRDRGTIVAVADRCTHRGGPLHEGLIEDGCVTCPWHGSRFRLADGAVAHGPATRPQPTFDVRVTDGCIEVRQAGQPGSLKTNPVA